MRDGESGRFSAQPVPARFERKIERQPDGCWIWTGGKFQGSGYGAFWIAPQNRLAHRVAFEMYVGPIPEGAHLDHLCRVRECVNPAHLEPVTPGENLARSPLTLSSINRAKTHCPSGHPYDDRNTYRPPGAPLTRQCRTCLGLGPPSKLPTVNPTLYGFTGSTKRPITP